MINLSNETYKKNNLAIIQKIPTPITPMRMDGESSTISLAYFEKKSTVDYMGVVQGVPICFDAKETGRKNLPLQNIHTHQIEFMESFQSQKGVAFLLVRFAFFDETYFLPFGVLRDFWDQAQSYPV